MGNILCIYVSLCYYGIKFDWCTLRMRLETVSLKIPPTHRPCHRPTGQWRGPVARPVGRCEGGSIEATRMHYRDGWLRVGCGV